MALKRRSARLESRKGPPVASDAKHRLAEKLARMEAAVMASGDASDRPEASLIERTVRRYIRGDAGIGDALRDLVAGRWP
jgi:hypothetical protein